MKHIRTTLIAIGLLANIVIAQDYSAWSNYKEITITAQNIGLTNYQIILIIVKENEMESNFADLRFVNSSDTELDYWVQDYNDTTATVWVKVNSISTAGSSIKMYYGNSNATDVQNPTNVFELYDGFNGNTLDQTLWTVTQQAGASYSFEDGALKLNVTQTDNFISVDSQNNYDLSQGFALLCSMKTQTNRGHFFGGFGDGNSGERLNYGGHNQLNGFGFNEGHEGPYGVRCSNDGNGIGYSFGNNISNYHLIEIQQDGNSIYNYLFDGAQEGSVDSTEIIDTGSRPFYFWLNGWDGNNRSAWIDYVAVRKYSNPEPTYQIGNALSNTPSNTHSLSFDGVDDYVNVAALSQAIVNSNATLMGWFKPDHIPVTGHDGIFGFRNYPSHNGSFYTVINVNGDYLENTYYSNQANIYETLNDSSWYHIALTVDGSNLNAYLNGQLLSSVGVSSMINDPSIDLLIGLNFSNYDNYYNGHIDEVSIWNTALTQAEIQTYLTSSPTGNETDLVGYWNFNEGSGTTLTDQTSNGNDGTIYGATWSTDVPFTGSTSTSDLTWSVQAKVTQSSYSDNDNYLGVASGATNGFDSSLEEVEPPASPGSSVSLYFPHAEWNYSLGDNFSKDVRPEIAQTDTMQVWDFEVTATDAGDATLTFVFTDVPSVPVILENTATGVRQTLSNNSTYTFTAVADSTHPFRISIGDTTAPSLTLGESCSGPAILNSDSTQALSWTTSDGFTVDSMEVWFSSDSGTTYNEVTSIAGADSYNWTVPDTTIIYNGMLKIKSKDYAGNTTEKVSDYIFAVVGDSISMAVTSGWNLWSAPINPANDTMTVNLNDDFTDYWVTYDYVNNGYTYDGILKETEGYWLGTVQNATIDVKGTALTSDQTMSLSQGWDLVSNPLVLNVSVDSLNFTKDSTTKSYTEAVTAGWVNSVYGYASSGYEAATVFQPWKGYWIGVLETDLTMTFPIHKTPSSSTSRSRDNGWFIAFDAQASNSSDETLVMGIDEMATDGFDNDFDAVTPPTPPGPEYVSLYISHPEWDYVLGDNFSKDIRGEIPENGFQEWIVEMETTEDNVEINWLLNNVPDDFEVGIDTDNDGFFDDMRNLSTITLLNNQSVVVRVGSGVLDVGEENMIPVKFALHQNYPNPFNPITTLRYDLPEQSLVNIIIYDIMGREVKTLVNTTQDAGFKSVIWNATNDYGKPVSAGLYLYRITAGNFHSVKKMVLLK